MISLTAKLCSQPESQVVHVDTPRGTEPLSIEQQYEQVLARVHAEMTHLSQANEHLKQTVASQQG